jgi:MFS family permease
MRPWLTRGILSVGGASFFSDAGHEIATSILATFVTQVLRGSAGALGVIEGISDAITGVMKLFGGPLANDPAKRGPMASGGYVVTALATGAIGVAHTVWQAGVLRGVAWGARGVRSPARDALLATLAPAEARGRAYGVERAGDNAGAVVGPLLAALLVSLIGVRSTIYLSAVPGLFAAAAITIAAREARGRVAEDAGGDGPESSRRLDLPGLRRAGLLSVLGPIGAFELGNMATTLLILRATNLLHHDARSLTAATAVAVLLYAAHNLSATICSLVGGSWIDRVNARAAFVAGALLYVGAYAIFSLPSHAWPVLAAAFVLAGGGIGFSETAESTIVSHVVPDRLRGSGFGLLGGIQSAGDLGSSLVVGILWTALSPTVAFLYAAAWMTAALVGALAIPRWRAGGNA